ncbi:MAG: cytochrome P460 family protein [Candidatus Methylomirabilia bacterium]
MVLRWGVPLVGLLLGVAVVGSVGIGEAQNGSLKAGPYKDYKQWARMNDTGVFSSTHGGSFVFTYVNPTGLSAAKNGKFPFPVGTVIVKEAFMNKGCKPGAPGAVFVMEKRGKGYDSKANDWHWVRYNPDGTLWGEGTSVGRVAFCAGCHQTAKVNDYVFGNGTTMKVTPTMPLTPCK